VTLPAGWVLKPPLSARQVADVGYGADFRGRGLVLWIAVTRAESGWVPNHRNVNTKAKGNARNSVDRGIAQINSYWHPEVSDADCDDPARAARATHRISAGGSNWTQWATFNDGKHLPFMAEAEAAARAIEAQPGPGGAAYTSTGARTPEPLKPAGPDQLTPMAARSPADLRVLRLRGRELGDFAGAVVGGRVDLSSDMTSELELTFLDPGLRSFVPFGNVGTPVDWFDLRLRVSAHELPEGLGPGHERFTLRARSRVVEILKHKAAPVLSGLTAAGYVQKVVEGVVLAGEGDTVEAGIGKAVVVGSYATRPTIGPEKTINQATGAEEEETAWEVMERLASEEGAWLFETTGEVVFGPPSSLVNLFLEFTVHYDPPDDMAAYAPLEAPAARRTEDDPDDRNAATVTVKLPRYRGERVRPGMRMNLYGVPGFVGSYIVTGNTWPTDNGEAPAVVTAVSPVDPRPTADEANQAPTATPAAPTSAGEITGTRSALDFVTVCLSQAGKRYVFGAEAQAADADPDAFDCSELIEWACARVGVRFVDGSKAQHGAIKAAGLLIPVETAYRTRGALLFRLTGDPTHVAVSLGDGRFTIEARGREYGTLQAPVTGRGWTAAGMIPGMVYPKPLRSLVESGKAA
jgi:cell wall-associated NlpC family hydrolase